MPLYSFYRWDNGAFLASQLADNASQAVEKLVAAGTDLSFVELRGLDLTDCVAIGAKLKNANMDLIKADGLDLRGATLTDANMMGTIVTSKDPNRRIKFQGAAVSNFDFTVAGPHERPSFETTEFRTWWNSLTAAQQAQYKHQYAEGID